MSKSGRPKGESDVRARLVDAARQLFTSLPYEKVTTRMLAEHAGVNIAMIRYYFGSKATLFQSMLEEVTAPVRTQVEKMLQDASTDNVLGTMTNFYQTMADNPDFPRLVYRLLTMPEGSEPKDNMIRILKKSDGIPRKIFQALETGSSLQQDVDPQMAWLSIHSLMTFPFLLQPILKAEGIDLLHPEFLEKLATHNSRLLTQGLLNKKD